MYNKCCVVSCGSRRKDVNFYRFPICEIELKKWLHYINCDRLRSLSLRDLQKHFVCKKHFEGRFLASTPARSRLRVGAYPTLFTDSEIASGVPQNPRFVDNTKNAIQADHNYLKKRQHEDHCYCKVEVKEKRPRVETDLDTISSAYQLPLQILDNYVPQNLPSTSNYKSTETAVNRDLEVTSRLPIQSVDNSASEMASTSNHENKLSKNSLVKGIKSSAKLSTSKRRSIIKKKALSPCCIKLYEEYAKSKKQLVYRKRAERALKFSKEKSFEKLTKNLRPLAKKILWMQIKQCTKQAKGRRYTNEEKLIALSIMKQSPKCYRFLHKIFILPSKNTLNKMVAQLNIEAGINPQIFEAVKREVASWDDKKKYCSILFDEIALETALFYDKNKDYIDGFLELNERTNEFADHALVFMLRGAIYKWQQPLAFYFCKGATSAVHLKNLLKTVIAAVGETGLEPIALISDQGTAFQSALKSLQDDTRREQLLAGDKIDDVVAIKGHTLSVIYDPPHLIKGVRNNFLNKNIKYKGKISKWSDIVEIYKTDCNHAQMRLLHKLNDEHVIPEKIKKMKVKNCVKVLSRTVASTLAYTAQFSHYADGKPVSETTENTSEMVAFFDDLFDSVNGGSLHSKSNKGKPLRQAVTEKSPNHNFWEKAIETLEGIKFIDRNGKESSVPSLKNWVVTLKSFQRLWQFFKSNHLKIMRPRYFNSDPIENFFGQVRAYNFRNNDPNCHTFKSTFRSLLITRFINFHSNSYNCEEDSSEQLLKIKSLFEEISDKPPLFPSNKDLCDDDVCNVETLESSLNSVPSVSQTASQERQKIHSRAYTTGWVVRKILQKIKCRQCEENLTSDEQKGINNYISFREYKSIKEKKLSYPSEIAVRFFGEIVETANNYLEKSPHRTRILKELNNIVTDNCLCYGFLTCETHKRIVMEYFVNLTLRLTVFNWCNVINKILKGTDVSRLENKSLPDMQQKAFIKYKTKLKNKKLNK